MWRPRSSQSLWRESRGFWPSFLVRSKGAYVLRVCDSGLVCESACVCPDCLVLTVDWVSVGLPCEVCRGFVPLPFGGQFSYSYSPA